MQVRGKLHEMEMEFSFFIPLGFVIPEGELPNTRFSDVLKKPGLGSSFRGWQKNVPLTDSLRE